ncbi:MAG: porin [Candidatus Entotheonella gemina]|uniref:Porin n=1 Tax=Candidatus Entotheonella gemina TaxID=1429439 RepID=W4MD92_9BACT|nr:MAG: porin [Candidatus Entotheonella gemina]
MSTYVRFGLVLGGLMAGSLSLAEAYDLTEKLSLGGVLAGIYQYQILDEDSGDDEGGGAVVFQPELSFRPTDRDEVFVKLGFAAGNGINDQTPFAIAPWAADLEDDVQDLNGRNRDYLFEAWYQHVFRFGPEHELGVSGGIIDATGYLEDTAYADDEFTQFLNEVFVNGPQSFVPSYDLGGVLEWALNPVTLRVVVMDVGANDDGNAYTFFGVQLAYTLRTALGTGTYRLLGVATTEDFLNPAGIQKEPLRGLTLSFDQELGKRFGVFVQLGWQQDEAAIDFKAMYAGGVNVHGRLWGRSQDHLGIGYAFLDGGNTGIERSHVFEAYVRMVFNDIFAVTVDLQYIDEGREASSGSQALIPGIRLTADF